MSNTLVARAAGFALSQFTDLASEQTLTNKTLTAPTISSIVNTGTLTLPTSTDTLIGRDTTDTLTNKTLTSPTITGSGSIAGVFTGDVTGDVTGTVTDISNHNTDDLDEGTSNQYYTDARARGSVSVTDSGGDGSLAYNSGTGVITYTGPSAAETRLHFDVVKETATSTSDLSYDSSTGKFTFTPADAKASVQAGTGVTYDTSTGTISIGQSVATTADVQFGSVDTDSIAADNITGVLTRSAAALQNYKTDDLDEGTSNQYYTDARARGSVSVTDSGGDGSLAYNSGTGLITYTGPSAAETRLHFSGGTGVAITDGVVSIGQSVGAGDNVTFNNVSVDGTLTTDDVTSASITANGNVTITGNLTVSGATTTVSSTTLEIGDNTIVLNKQLTDSDSPTQDAGIEIERGSADNVSFLWDETNDKWTTNASGTKHALEVGNLEAEDINLSTIYFGTNGSGADILMTQGIINASTGELDSTDTDSLVIKGLSDGGLEIDGDLIALKSSDKRLKDNVKAIEEPLEKIKKIGGYNYTWNELGEAHTMNKEGQNDVGVIAQEVEEIIPEAVTDKSNGYKAVQYEKIIPLLIECVKDQQTMIEKLQNEVEALKSFIPY